MSKISEVITLLSFSPLRSIQGRSSIADIFSVDKRCGIYILRFLNGEFYAGQALDVTRRYVQHRKTHNDIAEISFKQVASDSLDVAEREVIWTLEREDFHLRNIMFASIPKGESDFDFVMTVEEQKKWLDDFRYQDFGGARAQDDTLRRKYHQKFQRFSKRSSFSEAITILQRYMQQGVPVPVRSEMAFWGCSCMPGSSQPGINVYSRININWQEVFTICDAQGVFISSFHLALSPLEQAYGQSLNIMFEKHPLLTSTEHFYEPGGQDQLHIEIEGAENALTLLQDTNIVRAIRLFNFRLMKKGPCAYSRYHCMDLADKLLNP